MTDDNKIGERAQVLADKLEEVMFDDPRMAIRDHVAPGLRFHAFLNIREVIDERLITEQALDDLLEFTFEPEEEASQ